jgi:hypothetical protein
MEVTHVVIAMAAVFDAVFDVNVVNLRDSRRLNYPSIAND